MKKSLNLHLLIDVRNYISNSLNILLCVEKFS